MNLNLIVNFVGEASMLKNSLLTLTRITSGALNARSKREVERLVQRFLNRVQNLAGLPDPALQVVVTNMTRISQDLANCASNNNGGYLRIETLFSEIIAEMGYVQGYLFALSFLYDQKRRLGVDLNAMFA